MLYLILTGICGSGKGTQAKLLAKHFDIPHLSAGDILRAEASSNLDMQRILAAGNLLPNELVISIMSTKIKEGSTGAIIDGYPRTVAQAKALDEVLAKSRKFIINLDVREWAPTINRLAERLNCTDCGAVFNEITNPPQTQGKCDTCGAKLVKRADDNPESIRKRMDIYSTETKPILEYYRNSCGVYTIGAESDILNIFNNILEIIEPASVRD